MGRGRRQPALGRVAGPPVRVGAALVRRPLRCGHHAGQPDRVDPRRVRLRRQPAPDHGRGGLRVLPHPEAVVEPDQPLPAPHVLVGGHRRHPHLHPLPARRHLQRRGRAVRAGLRRPELPRQGSARRGRCTCSATATAAAAPPARCSSGPAASAGADGRRPRRPAAVRHRVARRVLRRRACRVRRRPRVAGRAVLRDAPRHVHVAGSHQVGQPAGRAGAARARGVDGHRCGAAPGPRRWSPWSGSGRCCCSTSSTTSSPARPSPGSTTTPRPPTPPCSPRPRQIIAAALAARASLDIGPGGAGGGQRRSFRRVRCGRPPGRAGVGRGAGARHRHRLRRPAGRRHARDRGRSRRRRSSLENDLVRATIGADGTIVSLVDLHAAPRVPAGSGQRPPALPRPPQHLRRLGHRPAHPAARPGVLADVDDLAVVERRSAPSRSPRSGGASVGRAITRPTSSGRAAHGWTS